MKKEVIFLHPDLGLGGAERLVVDAALALQQNDYSVRFITSYHSREHCFEETRNGTIPVQVVGEWIPRNIFGRFFALCAYLKMIYCSFYILFFTNPDVVFVDLVSACIPVLKLSSAKIVFYCHYPDQLLSVPSSSGSGFLKRLYRLPLDWVEEVTTGMADLLYVNSNFTKNVFKKTFTRLKVTPKVLYPSLNTKMFDQKLAEEPIDHFDLPPDAFTFLSLNRFELKKQVWLAIEALGQLRSALETAQWDKVRLIIAGGFDSRDKQNKATYDLLMKSTVSHSLESHVKFVKSPTDSEKIRLFKKADCLVYTPTNEHFGIVPLEAMYCSIPVIACNSGGPTETVEDNVSGFLMDNSPEKFSQAMAALVLQDGLKERFGKSGRQRFINLFSFEAFSNQLSSDIQNLLDSSKQT